MPQVGERQVPITDLDVVFLSYELLRRELSLHSPLLRFGFWRIMLDEAQMVANTNSVAAVMASQLWRRHAWVVTGTPVSSKLDEIRGLCEFLAVDPFHYNHSWQNLLARPYQAREVGGMLAMRSLLKGVMLRRTKVINAGGRQRAASCALTPSIGGERLVCAIPVQPRQSHWLPLWP